MPTESRVHEVTIKVHTNRAITAEQAQYAAWNALNNQPLYNNEDHRQPWSTGHITVRKTPAGPAERLP